MRAPAEDLRAAFVAFASFGAREAAAGMDGKALIKLAKDTGLMASGLSPTDVDLIFAKVRVSGAGLAAARAATLLAR